MRYDKACGKCKRIYWHSLKERCPIDGTKLKLYKRGILNNEVKV